MMGPISPTVEVEKKALPGRGVSRDDVNPDKSSSERSCECDESKKLCGKEGSRKSVSGIAFWKMESEVTIFAVAEDRVAAGNGGESVCVVFGLASIKARRNVA